MARKPLADDVVAALESSQRLAADAEMARLRAEVSSLRGRYKAALAQIDAERSRADSIAGLAGIRPARFPGKRRRPAVAKHSATAVVLLSDWHVEETVAPETVNFRNRFDLDTADARIAELAERFAELLEHERRLVAIDRVVVWLGGDFFSGAIHQDTANLAALPPLAALRFACERIRAFIDQTAAMAREVVVVTNSGNHGRHTEKLLIGSELDFSFEQHAYIQMAAQETNANVRWQVGGGYLNVLDLDGFKIRFHHGHAVRYSGAGVGGITIPINKSIAAWDKIEPADLTCQGHYHQFQWLRAGRYVCNGSVIGYSAYATMIKAAYEPPSQTFLVVDGRRREVTKAIPIFCDRDLERLRNG